MALEYKSNIGIEAITPILDEHVVWYGRMMRVYFERQGDMPEIPPVFDEWLTSPETKSTISGFLAGRIERLHGEMVRAGREFIAKATTRDVNPLSQFNELTRHYEEFIQYMRQIEREQALENSGVDEKTGLRSLKVMQDDILREMERRARRGNPFALALVKLNHFTLEWKTDPDKMHQTVRNISDKIRYCLRSFDDAYYLGNEYFLLSFKHADKVGSQAAVARVIAALNEAYIKVPTDESQNIAVSIVISEPEQGDNLDELIQNMKNDLAGIDAQGTVLQFNDISPLQRYIHSIKDGK